MLTNKVPEKDVNDLFTRVAPNYDLMNNMVSLGIQNIWRKQFLTRLNLKNTDQCLDLCCGTGDSTLALAKKVKLVTGLDFNQAMLKLAYKKVVKKHMQFKVKLISGDAMNLPFANGSFNCVTICFGLRNVPDAEKTIKEAFRVLKPGGQFAILEMSQPSNKIIKLGWLAYFKVFPFWAKLVNSNIRDYQYLSKTSKEFLTANKLKQLLIKNGFDHVTVKRLTGGAAAIHIGIK